MVLNVKATIKLCQLRRYSSDQEPLKKRFEKNQTSPLRPPQRQVGPALYAASLSVVPQHDQRRVRRPAPEIRVSTEPLARHHHLYVHLSATDLDQMPFSFVLATMFATHLSHFGRQASKSFQCARRGHRGPVLRVRPRSRSRSSSAFKRSPSKTHSSWNCFAWL